MAKAFRAEQQELLSDMYRLQWANVTDDGVRKRLQGHGIEATPEEVARNQAFLNDLQAGQVWPERPEAAVIAMSVEVSEPLGVHLCSRRWEVYKTPPILVTCDEPVVAVGGPGSPRSERSGVAEAGVVMFPLCPSALLVMFHADMRPQYRRFLTTSKPQRSTKRSSPVPPAGPSSGLRGA